MNSMDQEDLQFIPQYLSQLEETVLEELSLREKNYSFRFNGLRRILKDVHQQKLSRALERLLEDQLIEQYPDGGYGLDRRSYDRIREYFGNQHEFKDYDVLNSVPKKIYSALSPENNFPVQDIIHKLNGKYFGNFRFIGHYYSNGKGQLEWIHAEDHSRILISSMTSSKIEIVAYNVSQAAINKFLKIIQHFLIDYQIFLDFTETTTSQAN